MGSVRSTAGANLIVTKKGVAAENSRDFKTLDTFVRVNNHTDYVIDYMKACQIIKSLRFSNFSTLIEIAGEHQGGRNQSHEGMDQEVTELARKPRAHLLRDILLQRRPEKRAADRGTVSPSDQADTILLSDSPGSPRARLQGNCG